MKKLIRQLRFAHAAEIAAYHAYEGHWRSVTNEAEQKHIQSIALDEKKHIHDLEKMLDSFGYCPDAFLDKCGKVVGELIGLACFYSGWRLPMLVAGVMEKIGTSSYKDIAIEAAEQGRYAMASKLMQMAKVEQEHDEYFEKLRKSK